MLTPRQLYYDLSSATLFQEHLHEHHAQDLEYPSIKVQGLRTHNARIQFIYQKLYMKHLHITT